jgi:hypothetical protein
LCTKRFFPKKEPYLSTRDNNSKQKHEKIRKKKLDQGRRREERGEYRLKGDKCTSLSYVV